MTIYLFAIVFRAICNFDKSAFNPTIESLGTATYFSIVTIATVGYGDIVPTSGVARLLVSFEILSGLAYGVLYAVKSQLLALRTTDNVARPLVKFLCCRALMRIVKLNLLLAFCNPVRGGCEHQKFISYIVPFGGRTMRTKVEYI